MVVAMAAAGMKQWLSTPTRGGCVVCMCRLLLHVQDLYVHTCKIYATGCTVDVDALVNNLVNTITAAGTWSTTWSTRTLCISLHRPFLTHTTQSVCTRDQYWMWCAWCSSYHYPTPPHSSSSSSMTIQTCLPNGVPTHSAKFSTTLTMR